MIGSEDFSIGKHQNVFITQGDLHTAFNEGSYNAKQGHIWYISWVACAHTQGGKRTCTRTEKQHLIALKICT